MGSSHIEEQLRARLQREQRKLEAVRELGRALSSSVELDPLLELLVSKTRDLLDAERATLFLASRDKRELVSSVVQGGATPPIRVRFGEGIAGAVAQTATTINIPDAYADPRFNSTFDRLSGFRTRSILCMPLPDRQGGVIGVVQVLNRKDGRPFDPEDEALLAVIAAHAGGGLENARLVHSLLEKNRALLAAQTEQRQRLAELDLLIEVARDVASALDVPTLLDRLIGRALDMLDAEAGAVLLRTESGGELFSRADALDAEPGGLTAGHLRRTPVPMGRGLLGWVASQRVAALIDEPALDGRHDGTYAAALGLSVRNVLVVPILDAAAGSPALGAFEVINRRSGPFRPEDEKILTLLAGQVGSAITLQRGREEHDRSERLASLGQMVASVLHDLRTPMTISSGYTQLMAQCEDGETRQRFAELIVRQFDLMAAMTREVLLFARGQTDTLVRKVYMAKFVEELTEQIQREFASRPELGIQLRVDARYLGVAYLDEIKLYRAIHNLARNAAEAMSQGGTFTVTIDRNSTHLVLSFSDTGRGIPEALRDRLFQTFATLGKEGGTGLGLAMVKRIVDAHNGQITWESQPGLGTTFHLALPLRRPGQPSEDSSEVILNFEPALAGLGTAADQPSGESDWPPSSAPGDGAPAEEVEGDEVTFVDELG